METINKNINPGISIVICCYNSGTRIIPTLEHIAKQINSAIPKELIIVNNNSNDNTLNIVKETWDKCNSSIPFQIINETKPGLIYARETGFKAASYSYVLFCDDDNWLAVDYTQNAFNFMKAHPEVGALGGQGDITPRAELPQWWEKEKNCFAVGKQLPHSGSANQRLYLWGAGLVIRKELLEKVFDPNFPFLMTGRKGDQVISGDDSEICYRILLLGQNLYYNETLFYWHDIAQDRLNNTYLKQLHKSLTSEIVTRYYLLYLEFITSVEISLSNKIITLVKRSASLIKHGFSPMSRYRFSLTLSAYFHFYLFSPLECKQLKAFIKRNKV